jgi:WD40 repeat protein
VSTNAVAISPDKQLIAFATNDDVFVYDYATYVHIVTLSPSTSTVTRMSWTADSQYLALGCANSPYMVWWHRDTGTNAFTHLTRPSADPNITHRDASWGGNLLAITHNLNLSRSFKLFEKSGSGSSAVLTLVTESWTNAAGNGFACDFTPSGSHLVIGSTTDLLTLYRVDSGPTLTRIGVPSGAVLAHFADFSPNGQLLATGNTGNDTIAIYFLSGDSLTKITSYDAGVSTANNLRWIDNSRLILAQDASPYVKILLWDGATFSECLTTFTAPAGTANDVEFSVDGLVLAVAHATSPFLSAYDA